MNTFSIKTWLPQQWSQVAGNENLVEHFQDALRSIVAGETTDLNTMILGPSRSGKTALAKLFVQCLMCTKLDQKTLNPCGTCSHCSSNVARFGQEGLFTDAECGRFHYIPIDCANANADDIHDLVMRSGGYGGFRVIYLDEIHRLHRTNSRLEEMLLKCCTEEENCMWIGSSVSCGGLETMFQKRFIHIETQLPSANSLAIWLSDRCKDWGIVIDREETLPLLANQAKLVPGDTLPVLARAYIKKPRLLKRQLVEGHKFITAPASP